MQAQLLAGRGSLAKHRSTGWGKDKVLELGLGQRRLAPNRPAKGSVRLKSLALATMAASLLIGAATASAAAPQREVRYRGYAIEVPASWPVYHMNADPSRCVRFDRHAVYLGSPSADQRCPAHAVGRTEAILVEPLRREAGRRSRANTISLSGRQVAPRAVPPASSAEVGIRVPSAGVFVTATWRRDRPTVERIVRGADLVPGARHAVAAPAKGVRSPRRPVGRPQATASASYYTGLGFDACSTPPTTTMSAWLASPYRGIGIYIGGVNRACSQPNLSSAWVAGEIAAGWQLIPTYVGLQAPGNSCGCAAIIPAQAAAQGVAAAEDAVIQAAYLGIGPGNPIYFDMEYYPRNSTNSSAVLSFLGAWTDQLHARGYVSGVYGSVSSVVSDLVSQYGLGFSEPDDLWFAHWNGLRTTDSPYVPASYWSNHQRLHQYQGGHNETYGGVTINIDGDYLDGAVVGSASPPVLRRLHCSKIVFSRRPRSVAFNIRGFNLLHCGKARRVAAGSRSSRFAASGTARFYRKRQFTCRGHRVGSARVVYACRRVKAQIRFVRKG
jgi:glycoside hydrolase-like protein